MMPVSSTSSGASRHVQNPEARDPRQGDRLDAYERAKAPCGSAGDPPGDGVGANGARSHGLQAQLVKALEAVKAAAWAFVRLFVALPGGLLRLVQPVPTAESCREEMSRILFDMAHMEWPQPELLPRYRDVLHAEIALFAQRIKDVQCTVSRRGSGSDLANRLRKVQRQFSEFVSGVVMNWADRALTHSTEQIMSILASPKDFEGDYGAITDMLARCMLVVVKADELRRQAPGLSKAERDELGARMQERKDALQEIHKIQREKFRVPLGEQLWDAIVALKAVPPAQRLEHGARLRQTVMRSRVLDEQDRGNLCDEIDSQLGRGTA